MAVLSNLSLTAVFDEHGRPHVGAVLRVYDAGTTTPRTAYHDGDLETPYPWIGLKTNGAGRIPVFWIAGDPYRVQITTSGGTLIEDIDNIPADVDTGGGPTPTPDSAVVTGDVIWSYRTGTRLGWVRANGRSIGNLLSGASERANADCEALFTHLWNADATLTVSGGRGVSAAADWAANKTIIVPDIRGRSVFGLANMGNSTSTLLDGALFATGNRTTLGSVGGEGVHTLTGAEIPGHTHTGTTASSGAHTHTGTTASDGAHNHTGSTSTDGNHSHSYEKAIGAWLVDGAPGGPVYGGQSAATTGNAGDHSHTFTTASAGAHTHTFTTASAGDHTHTFTTASTGDGGAHNTMPPFILGTFYLKL